MAEVSNSNLLSVTGISGIEGACVVIVRTEWNAPIVGALKKGCKAVLEKAGVSYRIVTVPGAFEIPFGIRAYWDIHKYRDDRPQAFIALGCVLRGDTPHFEYVSGAVTDGILQLNMTLPIPTIFGILTVDTQQQADERIGGKHGHKGEEAAITALKMIAVKKDLSVTVQLFIPCFVDQLYPETAFNMVKVLEKAGVEVSYNEEQTCCGQPAFNAGFRDEAREVCTKFLKDFEGHDYIVAPSASCVGFVRNYYGTLFNNSSVHNEVRDMQKRIFEFSSFLVNVLGVVDLGASLYGKATYHDSCAGLRECRIKEEPRKLLSRVKGLDLLEMNDVDVCCGFGGSFAVKFESISVAMADQKVNNALQTGADYIISTDLSCLMHLDGYIRQKGHSIRTMHIADVLANF